jgi:hypothetical protein
MQHLPHNNQELFKGGDGRVEQENNTQGGGNDPLSQMGKSIGNIFGQ